MTMSRERLEGILRQELPYSQMRERGITEILAEYDSLTTINKQLVEALGACLPVMAELHDWRMAQEAIPLVTAAIRAAEDHAIDSA